MAGKPILKRYAELAAEKAELEDKLRAVKVKMERIEQDALDFMLRHEIERQSVAGRTLYIEKKVWASKAKEVELPEFLQALREHGMEEFQSYSPQRLTAFVRELEDSGEGIPEWLIGLINVDERHSLRSRKS